MIHVCNRLRAGRFFGFLLALLGVGAISCTDAFVPAVGPNADVSVFTAMGSRDPLFQPLLASLQREVYTTRTENAFRLEFTTPGFFRERKEMKNLLIVAALDRPDPTVGLVEEVVGKEVYREFQEGTRPYAIYSDLYAVGQTVIVIAAPTYDALESVVAEYSDALYDSLESRLQRGLTRVLYIRGEHPELEDYLRRDRNWSIRIPREYEVEEDVALNQVIAHTSSPERWLFVQSLPLTEDFSPENVLAIRKRNRYLYVDDELPEEELIIEPTPFAGREGYLITGRWQSPSYVVGGPFRCYVVPEGDRMFLVNLFVFLPAHDKYPYLRQLEAIASTFEFVERP